jgi:hypothetical protein
MRKGDRYRIGQCQIFNKSGITHLAFRMRQESADGMWILTVSEDKNRILAAEQVLSVRYQLPQMCFSWRPEVADVVFEMLDTKRSAERCLANFSLDIEFPLLSDDVLRSQSGGTSLFECRAVNLRPEIMMLPKFDGNYKKTFWEEFTVRREDYRGPVYGLDVEKYHTYVTNGIATHNSVFTYSGANPGILIDLATTYKTVKLEKSYRLPRAVYAFAKGITNIIEDKIEKDYKPARTTEGFVKDIADRNLLAHKIRADFARAADKPYRWYLLFRNNCFISEMVEVLEQACIPYHTARGFCLEARNIAKIKRYYNFRKEGFGTKESFAKFQEEYNIKNIEDEFIESDLIPGERRYVYYNYTLAYGIERLEEFAKAREPFLLLSTTHRVKGGEADYVAVFLDCTRKVSENALLNVDEELRVLYVACTRAKEGLYLVQSQGRYGLENVVQMAKEMAG